MCKRISTKEFRRKIELANEGRLDGIIMQYLNVLGYVGSTKDGMVEVQDDLDAKIKKITAEVQRGDIVWTPDGGLFLVIDKHPKANDDGHHYRGIRVSPSLSGSFTINADKRSTIMVDTSCLIVRHTSFDVDTINDLCTERYHAYTRIAQINNALSSMKE